MYSILLIPKVNLRNLNKTKDFAGKELYAKMKAIRETYKDDSDYQINVAKEILKVIEQYGVEYIR